MLQTHDCTIMTTLAVEVEDKEHSILVECDSQHPVALHLCEECLKSRSDH